MPNVRSVGLIDQITGLIRDIFAFAKYPTLARVQLRPRKFFLAAFSILCAVDWIVSGLAWAFLLLVEAAGYQPPQPIIEDKDPSDLAWLGVLVIAPLVEELLYRGWLSGRLAALRFALVGWMASALLLFQSGGNREIAIALVVAAFSTLMIGAWYWVLYRDVHAEVPEWFERHFPWIVWASSIAFGLMHLGNYDGEIKLIDCIVVLPQTFGGVILAYTRTRLGLRAAITQHTLFNFAVAIAFAA